ncbi:MAG: hypothetical protein M3R40_03995, partial [Pseudomonadota bacterium]|nr:hypothetical protein [Pseudomonadota bacterium]
MNWLNEPPKRYDVVTIPIIWVAIVLSILVHLAAWWAWLPRLRLLAAAEPSTTSALAVQLTPPASQVASAAAAAPPQPVQAEPRAAVPVARARPV